MTDLDPKTPRFEGGGPAPELFAGPAADALELLGFFAYGHLPPHLQAVSEPFASLAAALVATLPACRERTKALDRLLEAKDCAVRARLRPRERQEITPADVSSVLRAPAESRLGPPRERQEITAADVGDVSSVLGPPAESKP